MDWQVISTKVQEILDLQQQLIAKMQTEEIRMVLDRNNKYKDMTHPEISKLNNALLEHKIRVTAYQMIIFNKVNSLTAKAFKEALYVYMPKKLEEANDYVNELLEKFELAVKSL